MGGRWRQYLERMCMDVRQGGKVQGRKAQRARRKGDIPPAYAHRSPVTLSSCPSAPLPVLTLCCSPPCWCCSWRGSCPALSGESPLRWAPRSAIPSWSPPSGSPFSPPPRRPSFPFSRGSPRLSAGPVPFPAAGSSPGSSSSRLSCRTGCRHRGLLFCAGSPPRAASPPWVSRCERIRHRGGNAVVSRDRGPSGAGGLSRVIPAERWRAPGRHRSRLSARHPPLPDAGSGRRCAGRARSVTSSVDRYPAYIKVASTCLHRFTLSVPPRRCRPRWALLTRSPCLRWAGLAPDRAEPGDPARGRSRCSRKLHSGGSVPGGAGRRYGSSRPDRSGKTTLLEALAGQAVAAGADRACGTRRHLRRAEARRVGSSTTIIFFPPLTVGQHRVRLRREA